MDNEESLVYLVTKYVDKTHLFSNDWQKKNQERWSIVNNEMEKIPQCWFI